MQGEPPDKRQRQFLYEGLAEMLNPQEPLYKLGEQIDWDGVVKEFSKYYVDFGRPSHPTRLMVSLLLLKQLFDIGDEKVVEQWTHNPYWQYFGGQSRFQWKAPCDASDLVHFRKRIGKEGVQKIFELSVRLHKRETVEEREVVVDTTVQEKNITFPTDTKLYRKITERCLKIAKKEGIGIRRSYVRTIKRLIFAQRGRGHPRGHNKAVSATKKLGTIAGRLVRELERKLPTGRLKSYAEVFGIFNRVLDQQLSDKDKIYSLHEPDVYCISKGKDHKKYEFGTKVSIAMTRESCVIVSAMNFEENRYDGHTLPEVLEDITTVVGKRPEVAVVDQGYRGVQRIGETEVVSAKTLRSAKNGYQKRKTRERLRRRAAIEPVIGHLKSEFRLVRNYLKGTLGDHINVLLAASAYNINKWLRMVKGFILPIIEKS
jgi:IS5 family transposase